MNAPKKDAITRAEVLRQKRLRELLDAAMSPGRLQLELAALNFRNAIGELSKLKKSAK